MFPDTPGAVFVVNRLPELPERFFDGQEVSGELTGSLQIGEAITRLSFAVTARHDGDIINILGRTAFTWDQLELAKPSARSVVSLGDVVNVQVLIVAHAQ